MYKNILKVYSVQSHQEEEVHLPTDDVVFSAVIRSNKCTFPQAMLYSVQNQQEKEVHLQKGDVVLCAESSGERSAPSNRRCCTLCRVIRSKKCTSQQAMSYSVQSHQEQEMQLPTGGVVLCVESSGARNAPPNRRCCTLCRVIRSKKCTSQETMLYSVQSHQEQEMHAYIQRIIM